jgi:23S rRNA pseudouridine2605 synthase
MTGPEIAPGPATEKPGKGERIAKFLAHAGVASRRDAEKIIADGRVKLNGKIVEHPSAQVGPGDIVLLDNAVVAAPGRARVFRYHKPSGLVTTHRDPQGRKTVFETLPAEMGRVVSVGRLDLTSEGLLLLTNDGELARALELPSNGWIRRYRVRVYGMVDQQQLADLSRGIVVEGVRYGAIEAALDSHKGANAWLSVGLQEGKNREVRKIMAALGLTVTRLIRISYGPFLLGTLPAGSIAEVAPKQLRDWLGNDFFKKS